MVLNGIIQAYRTQIHLTLQGVYAVDPGPCEWLIECSSYWKARLSVSSSLFSIHSSAPRRAVLHPPGPAPEIKGKNKRSACGQRWRWRCRNFEIWQGERKRIADTSIKSWFSPGPFAARRSLTLRQPGRIQIYIYHPFICEFAYNSYKSDVEYPNILSECARNSSAKTEGENGRDEEEWNETAKR